MPMLELPGKIIKEPVREHRTGQNECWGLVSHFQRSHEDGMSIGSNSCGIEEPLV